MGTWLRAAVVALFFALTAWQIFERYHPVIAKVPVVAAGGELVVLGSGFGEGPGHLRLEAGEEPIELRDGLAWSARRIRARLPDPVVGGRVRVVARTPLGAWKSQALPFVVQADGLPSQPFGYAVPVQAASPWPLFRRDHRNTGRSPVVASYHGDRPWSFPTGKGIFSTPVVDADGTIYVGSADHVFYAIRPDGSEKWRFATGEIIDSAAALPRGDPETGAGRVIVPSGDGFLYALRTDGDRSGRAIWAFDARVAPRPSYNNWFEAHVAVGHDGALYAGNTNFNYYALDPDGGLRWTYETGANAWSMAGIGDDGTIYWASLDTAVRAVRPDGIEKWRKRTLGFVAASPAIGSDGTVYIGSFDSHFYALDPESGDVLWEFDTGDHIYASAALGADADGNTDAIYFGSADGIFYALDPEGRLLWRYDAGDPIRSSAALGAGPGKGSRGILYFGSGNGRLHALEARDGSRRFSFDATSDDPILAERNDLNASVALGETGIFIGGEDGHLRYVPYDYCLHVVDGRCRTQPVDDGPADAAGLFSVSPGGNTRPTGPATLPVSTVITLRLVVRSGGETLDAWMCKTPLLCPDEPVAVTSEPPFDFSTELSADGRYLHIRPVGLLEPGTPYTLSVEGDYYTGGTHIGNLTLGGDRSGRFSDRIRFRTHELGANAPPLRVGPDAVTAFEWTRLSLPIPTMLPSLNQIGFDYIDWLVGTVAVDEPDAQGRGRLLLWAIGARRDESGALVADPQTDFTLPLSGVYRGDAVILTNRSFTTEVTGIPIPLHWVEMRGQLGSDLAVGPQATFYAESEVLSIPTFGPYLVIAGLASNVFEKLVVSGTYVTRAYPDAAANRRPAGVSVESLDFAPPAFGRDGRLEARLRLEPGARYPLADHRPGIVLVDADRTEAVPMDYHANLSAAADAGGNASRVVLAIPAGTELPERVDAVVMFDVFPAHRERLEKR
jgi:outer membrane protein assembly factor BamB